MRRDTAARRNGPIETTASRTMLRRRGGGWCRMTLYDELCHTRMVASDDLKRVAQRREEFHAAFVTGLAEFLGCPQDRVRAEFTGIRKELEFRVQLALGSEWAPLTLEIAFPPGRVVVSDRGAGMHFRVWESELDLGLQPVFEHVVERLAQWSRTDATDRSKQFADGG